MVRSYLKILFSAVLTGLLCLSAYCVSADQIRVLVAPVNVATIHSSYTIYPNVSSLISNDIINELNKDHRFNTPDLNTIESILMSQGLFEKHRDFLKNYKDHGIIDHKYCGILNQSLGIDKVMLVTSAFSLQNMILKRSFLHRIGLRSGSQIQPQYQLNVKVMLVDTQTGIVDFTETYERYLNAQSFEIPTYSMSDNIVSTEEIRRFSRRISKNAASRAFSAADETVYSRVKSSLIPAMNFKSDTREGQTTRDGHFYSGDLRNKRIESFKEWAKQGFGQ